MTPAKYEVGNNICDYSSLIANFCDYSGLVTAIIAAIVGALSAYIFNWLHWRYARSLARQESYVEAIGSLLKEFDVACAAYWSQPNEGYTGVGQDSCHTIIDRRVLEAAIKRLHMHFSRHGQDYLDTYYHYDSVYRNRITSKLNELYEWATGDDFESVKRATSNQRCLKVSGLCVEIVICLSQCPRAKKT